MVDLEDRFAVGKALGKQCKGRLGCKGCICWDKEETYCGYPLFIDILNFLQKEEEEDE